MNPYARAILATLRDRPVGWQALSSQLEERGRAARARLPMDLQTLLVEGLIKLGRAKNGATVYRPTEKGLAALE